MSERATVIHGLNRHELMGKNLDDPHTEPHTEPQTHLSRLRATLSAVNQAVARGRTLGTLTVGGAGPGMPQDDVIQLLTDVAGQLALAVEHFTSEPRQLEAEVALRQSEARLASTQAIGRIGDWRFQASTRRVSLSIEACRMLGLAAEATALPLRTLMSHYDAASRRQLWQSYRLAISTRGRTEVELSTLAVEGRVQQHAMVMIPEFNAGGSICTWVGTLQDITERRALEAERVEVARRLEDMSRRVVSVQEDERRKLSVELHDRTGANLAAINLNLAAIARVIRRRNAEDNELFEETSALVSDTVVSIREFCSELRPSTLDYAGLVPALDNCLHQFGRRNHCATQFQHAAFSGQCSADVESLLFRIAQEALLNCRKHAQPSAVHVLLSGTPEHLTLAVTDDGKGFDLAQLGRAGHAVGQGLLNMRERAAFAGGNCTIISRPGHGTTVRVQLGTPPG